MAEGATYSIVPFVNKKAIGTIAGIVGAGGNVGAVLAGFLFKDEALSYSQALFYIGCAVVAIGIIVPAIRFTQENEEEVRLDIERQFAFQKAD